MIELASVIIFGILAQWFAWRFKIPAILPLLLIGLLLGPVSTLFTEDGSKWLEPIWNGTKGLFPGHSLFYFVSLSISIILFEGGLTLKLNEVKNVSSVITKLITIGSLVTFIGAAIAVFFIFNLSWEISFLFSALIIVTGPTVITPILRNIPMKRDISAILKWEGILIDPIGALVAVLVFEFISVEEGHAFTKTALIEFGKIVFFGATFGFTFAHAMVYFIKKKLIPHYLLNAFALAMVLGVFVLSDTFAHESGLLAVVVMGMVIGNIGLPNLKDLLYFKETLSVLLISILFILLSANINIADLLAIYQWNTLWLFLVIVFLIRPIGVFLSTMNSSLKTKEKLFISWVGPRGIVAAGIASLFGLKLVNLGIDYAELITPLVFMIVLGTVLLNATTARFVAKLLGIFLKKSNGVLIIGAGAFSRIIAQYLKENNRHVVLVDANYDYIQKAKALGIEAIQEDVFSDELENNIELTDIGYLMALTPNAKVNSHCISKYREQFGEHGSFRLISPEERYDKTLNPKEGLFSHTDDFVKLADIVRKNPQIHEIEIKSEDHYKKLIEKAAKNENIVTLFIKLKNGDLKIIHANALEMDEIKKGNKLIYIGEELK